MRTARTRNLSHVLESVLLPLPTLGLFRFAFDRHVASSRQARVTTSDVQRLVWSAYRLAGRIVELPLLERVHFMSGDFRVVGLATRSGDDRLRSVLLPSEIRFRGGDSAVLIRAVLLGSGLIAAGHAVPPGIVLTVGRLAARYGCARGACWQGLDLRDRL